MQKECSIDECGGRVVARGWCAKHYARWYRHGDPSYVTDNSGENNPMYKHGEYCTPSLCECGREKDHRSEGCAICAGSSFPISGEEIFSVDDAIMAISLSKNYLESAMRLSVSRQTLMRKIEGINIDISHFAHGRGRPIKTSDLLSKNSGASRGTVRKRVKDRCILPYCCKTCGLIAEWQGEPLSLQLDHINGDSRDHRTENLRWLCPNCHSQTPTYTGNRKKGKEV